MARGPAAGRGRTARCGARPAAALHARQALARRHRAQAAPPAGPGSSGTRPAPAPPGAAPGGARPPGRPGRTGGASGRRIDPARLVAFEVLRAVRERDAYANLLLPALLRERGLTGRDAAFATELSYGTLRGQGTYDAVIAACSARGLDRIDPPVRDVLRLGAHQLLATRVGAHAAVATSVDLAREAAGPGASGFVNAVLRRVASRDLEAWIAAAAPDRAADPIGHLAVRYSHPALDRQPPSPSHSARTQRPGWPRPRPRWPRPRSGRRWPCARCPGSPARQNSWLPGRSRPAGLRSAPIWRRGDPAAVAAVAAGPRGGAG